MPREDRPDGLPESHLTLTYFETSTWAHLRLGVRRGGRWLPTGGADSRLGALAYRDAVDNQLDVSAVALREFLNRLEQQRL